MLRLWNGDDDAMMHDLTSVCGPLVNVFILEGVFFFKCLLHVDDEGTKTLFFASAWTIIGRQIA